MQKKVNANQIFDKVAIILSDMLKIETNKIQLNSKLTEELGVDSVDFIDIVIRVSEAFNIEISLDDQLPPFLIVADVVEFIEQKIKDAD